MLNHTTEEESGQDQTQMADTDHRTRGEYRLAEDELVSEMSESEEMYLITVAQLAEQGVLQPIAISRLARELTIQPVSANQMVHKLEEEGMLEYLPYKGVQLTTRGQQVAQQVLRHRRLWQVFLEENLQIPTSEADALACRLEHITPTEVVNRLAEFLGNPGTTPQGLPIPKPGQETSPVSYRSIADVQVGEVCEIVQIQADQTTRAFLGSSDLRPGQIVTALAADSNGALLLQVGEHRVHVTGEVCQAILVK